MKADIKKYFFISLVALVAIALVYIILCRIVFTVGHGVVEVLSIKPNGPYTFVLFTVDSGATTSEASVHGALLHGDKKADSARLLSDDNHIFSCDSDHGRAPTDRNGVLRVDAKWIEKDRVWVTLPRQSRMFLKKTNHGEIKIEYGYFAR